MAVAEPSAAGWCGLDDPSRLTSMSHTTDRHTSHSRDTTLSRDTTSTPRVPRHRQLLCAGAALATLPYIALKVAWLSGSDTGLTDPSFGHSTAMLVANAVTLGLDVAALALAGVLGTRRGLRAPAWTVLLPLWVGAGLLVEILLLLPLTLSAGTVGSRPSSGPGLVADWGYVLVYAGFAALGLCLLPAFAGYAWQRWAVSWALRAPAVAVPHRALTLTGAAAAVLAGVSWGGGVALGGDSSRWLFVDGVMAALAAGGLLTLRRGSSRVRRLVPVAAALVGTGGLFAWGLFHTASAAGSGPVTVTSGTALAYSAARLLAGLAGGVALLRALSSR